MAIEWLPDNNKFTWIAYGNASDTQLSNSANDKEFVYIAFNKDKKEQSFKIDDYDLKINNSYSKSPYVYPSLLNKLPAFYAPLTFDLKGQINSICPRNKLDALTDPKHRVDFSKRHTMRYAGLVLACPRKSIELSQTKDTFKASNGTIDVTTTVVTDQDCYFGLPVGDVKNYYHASFDSDRNVQNITNLNVTGAEFEMPELSLKVGESFSIAATFKATVLHQDLDTIHKIKFEEYGVSDTEIIYSRTTRFSRDNECRTTLNLVNTDNCVLEKCSYEHGLNIPKLYRAKREGIPKFRFTCLNEDGTNISNLNDIIRLSFRLYSASKEICTSNIDKLYPEYLTLKLANKFKTNDFAYKLNVSLPIVFDDQKVLILCGTDDGSSLFLYDDTKPFKFESRGGKYLYTIPSTQKDTDELSFIGGIDSLDLDPNKFAFMLYRRGKDLVFRYIENINFFGQHEIIDRYDRTMIQESDVHHYEAVAKDVDNYMHEITLYFDSKTRLHHIYVDGELKGSSTRQNRCNKTNKAYYNMPEALIFGTIANGNDFHHEVMRLKDVTVYVDNCPFLS